MIKRICFAIILHLITFITGKAQSEYLIGTSSLSIEPDSSIFSVALAGYGAPREGRFSLTWKEIGDMPQTSAMTGMNGKLYIITNTNEVQEGSMTSGGVNWRSFATTGTTKSLTSLNGKLYAVSPQGKLSEGQFTGNRLIWKAIPSTMTISCITGLNKKLYATTPSNDQLVGTFTPGKITWTKKGRAYRIMSMTNDGQQIYSLNSGDTLWCSKPGQAYKNWREIGRHNSYTFNIRIKQVAVVNGRLYALSQDNKIYLAEHKTKGDLSVRALTIKQADKTAVIVAADVTGFNYTFTKEIKEAIYKKRRIPASAILINATHTHFAPVTQAWRAWGDFYHNPDSNYLNKILKAKMIQAIESSLDNAVPSEIYFTRSSTNIGNNRRAANNLEAPYDKTLDLLKLLNKTTQQYNLLFMAGCHPVFNNDEPNSTFTLSANYPGVAKNIIESKTGSQAMFLQGFGGDINPRETNYEHTGKELANNVLDALEGDMKILSGNISYSLDSIHIPVEPWSLKRIQEFKAANIAEVEEEKKITAPYSAEGQFALTLLLEREKNVRWANILLNHYKNGTLPKTMPLYVQIINIGDWKLVGLSREVTTEYAEAIRNIWPNKIVSVAGYCNDVPSYLPRDWHIHAKTYEGYDSFFWYGQAAIPPVNVREIVLNGIKNLKR